MYYLKKTVKQKMRNIYIILFSSIFILGCLEEEEPETIFPKEYFPAYPASYWIYSNGETVKVDAGYHLHSYEDSINSNHKTEAVYVPRIDGQYVYEYGITQNSTRVPLKNLLQESVSTSPWVVEYWNGKPVYRKVLAVNNTVVLYDSIYNIDETFTNVISVIEYAQELSDTNWFVKEYYAQYVGLIRKEINNYQDTLNPLIVYDLVDYYVNHNFN
jgi:hypothetical protein